MIYDTYLALGLLQVRVRLGYDHLLLLAAEDTQISRPVQIDLQDVLLLVLQAHLRELVFGQDALALRGVMLVCICVIYIEYIGVVSVYIRYNCV
jgi:hypothetical protein